MEPPQLNGDQATWSEVTRRPKKKAHNPQPDTRPKAQIDEKIELLRRRAPKTAAVTIDRPPEGGSLAEVMRRVSQTIDLSALGVNVINTRRTRAGGILIEVEGQEKATLLAERVRVMVGDGARVRLPASLTPVLLLDVPEWAAKEEIIEGLQKAGIDVGEAASSSVSTWKNAGGKGGYVARVNLPFREAIKVVEARAITVGWTRCKVKPIEKTQPICFRCQERGHFAAECKNSAKPRRCHGCGAIDHIARDCGRSRQPKETAEQGAVQEEVQAGGNDGLTTSQLPPTDPEVELLERRGATTSQPDRAK